MHDFVVTDDLDADLLPASGNISSTDDVGEDALPGVAEHVVAAVQHFARLNPVIPEDENNDS